MSERRQRRPRRLRNLTRLSAASFLNDAASEMAYPLLPAFLVATLGAGPAFLGMVEGVADSLSSLLKLVSGWLSDRSRRRRPLVVAGYGLAALARPLLALAAAPWHVLAVRVADRTGKGLRTAPRDALLAASVPARSRGAAFGIHRAADHAGAVVGPLLASGLLLLLEGRVRVVFALAALPGLAAVAMTLGLRERRPRTRGTPAAAPPPHRPLRLPDGPLGRYLLVLVLFTLGNATDAFLLLRAQQLGVPLAALPLLWSAHHVAKTALAVPGGRLGDRLGPVPAIAAGWGVYALTYAGFAAAAAPWHAWALFLLYGLFFGLTEAPEKALVAALAPRHRRGAAFGAYHFAIGVAALPASILFGVVWAWAGAPAAFAMGASVALVAAGLLVAVVPRHPRGAA